LYNFNINRTGLKSFEEMDDVQIFSNHNLNITDINALATHLAEVFNVNIEYVVYQNGTTLQNTISGNILSEHISALYEGEKNNTNYVLEIGEAALFISNNIIVYNLATIESFEMLLENHNSEKDNLLSDNYFKKIIEELNQLGATEIFFAEDTNEIRTLKLSENTFEQYAAFVKANTNYFTIQTNTIAENK
jgi:hypothetical protein